MVINKQQKKVINIYCNKRGDWVFMDQIEAVIEELYANNESKLHQLCQKEMKKFGGIYQKDYDDFYSRAGYEIALAKKNYNPLKGNGMEYIAGIIRFSILKEMRDRNRRKRQIIVEMEEGREYLSDIFIDMPVEEESKGIVGEMIPSGFNLEETILEKMEGYEDKRIEQYLNHLPKVQREILEMKMESIPVSKIKEKLGLSDKLYKEYCKELKSFSNMCILYKDKERKVKEDKLGMSTITQTMENCKTDKISISSIIKKIEKHTIRFDHPLQRESEQWSPSMKGNLVSDILQGHKLHPLIFAEQIINGVPIIWDLDGKQRCTNAYLFSKNGYKVSKNIRRWMISYQIVKKDEKGKDVLDKNGFPMVINVEFDIRGKKFSDLPEELQDRFLDYSFNYDQYLNCSEEDIGYHIERYNDGKPMTSPQKGITKLGTEYAEMVKAISNMLFFKEKGAYKVSEFRNGTINRVIVESIMAVHYLDKWNKLEEMCKYIKENATIEVFRDFEKMVGRLEKVITDKSAHVFNSKDSFLWFALFARFRKIGIEDKKFVEFIIAFTTSLHSKGIDGVSFDSILANTKSTKDKGIVRKKIIHLEKLMKIYLAE